MLTLYRRLLELRRSEPALSRGSYATVHIDDRVYAYARTHGQRTLVIALNLTPEPTPVPSLGTAPLTTGDHEMASTGILGPDEGRITLG